MLHFLFTIMALLASAVPWMADGGGDDDDDGGDPPGGTGDNDDKLRDEGMRALERERERRRKATQRAADLEAKLKELEDRVASDDTEATLKKAVRDARNDAEAQVRGEYHQRILGVEILSAATGKMKNPNLAAGLITLPDDLDVDGDVEDLRATIAGAIDSLLTAEPYLRADAIAGDGDGGPKPPPTDTDDEPKTPAERLRRAYAKKEKQ